jgi:hypothetical protein
MEYYQRTLSVQQRSELKRLQRRISNILQLSQLWEKQRPSRANFAEIPKDFLCHLCRMYLPFCKYHHFIITLSIIMISILELSIIPNLQHLGLTCHWFARIGTNL